MEKVSSNRSLGLVFFVVFLIISIWPLFDQQSLRIWSLVISLIFLVLGLLNAKILTPLNLLWTKFGYLLGRFVSPIIMSLVYFVVLTPIGLLMRLLGKDLLNMKFNTNKTYWIKRKQNIGSMKRQF